MPLMRAIPLCLGRIAPSWGAFLTVAVLVLNQPWESAAATGSKEYPRDPYLVLGPMLGHVGPEDARIWVRASRQARLGLLISEDPDLDHARWVTGTTLIEDAGFCGAMRITGLKPGHRYHYAVLLDGRQVMTAPYPSFTAAPAAGRKGRVRFAFTSCSGYKATDPAAGLADLAVRSQADLFLMLGDNHYANSADPEKQRFAYHHQRQSAGFRELTSRIPTYGIWDDHDFGPNNSDGTLKNKDKSLKTFREHWANPAYGEAGNPGVYFQFSRGDVDFFMLDDRYHRSPNKAPDDGTKTMLGPRQVDWLKRGLKASKARIKVIASGGEWQSHGTEDSWAHFRKERDDIFGFIEEQAIEGVLLISGDRHWTAAYQVEGRFLEVTSGPLGGDMGNTKMLPEMFLKQTQGRFYCVLDLDTRPQQPSVTLEVFKVGVGRVVQRTFTWEEITGRKKIGTKVDG